MERKTVPFAIKQADLLAQGVIEGYAAVIGNVDDGNDVIHPSALTRLIGTAIRSRSHPQTAAIRQAYTRLSPGRFSVRGAAAV